MQPYVFLEFWISKISFPNQNLEQYLDKPQFVEAWDLRIRNLWGRKLRWEYDNVGDDPAVL